MESCEYWKKHDDLVNQGKPVDSIKQVQCGNCERCKLEKKIVEDYLNYP